MHERKNVCLERIKGLDVSRLNEAFETDLGFERANYGNP
jgi:hypothetical protein